MLVGNTPSSARSPDLHCALARNPNRHPHQRKRHDECRAPRFNRQQIPTRSSPPAPTRPSPQSAVPRSNSAASCSKPLSRSSRRRYRFQPWPESPTPSEAASCASDGPPALSSRHSTFPAPRPAPATLAFRYRVPIRTTHAHPPPPQSDPLSRSTLLAAHPAAPIRDPTIRPHSPAAPPSPSTAAPSLHSYFLLLLS